MSSEADVMIEKSTTAEGAMDPDPTEVSPSVDATANAGTDSSKRVSVRANKRPAEPLSEEEAAQLQLKRLRQRLSTTPRCEINAVMVLNEYKKGLSYEISETGSGHTPFFTVRLEVDGQVFGGTGTAKKKAKLVAAEAALNALFGDVLTAPDVVSTTSYGGDVQPVDTDTSALGAGVNGMNPTIVLSRLRPGITYEDVNTNALMSDDVTSSAGVPPASHCLSCVVDGVTYIGTGSNKKMAKARTAAEALEKAFGISCTQTATGFPLFVGELPPCTKLKEDQQKLHNTNSSQQLKLPELLCSLPNEKNPVQFLHEIYPTAEYAVSEAPVEQGVFAASIPIEGKVFEGQGTTKKAARTSAAISAVNYLHQTGYMTMRLAEKASQKKLKLQPQTKARFSQDTPTQVRGGSNWRRGRGRGRGGTGNGFMRGSMKSTSLVDGSNDSSWISGGVLKAGDFMGMNSAPPGVAANEMQFSSDQEYYQQTGYTTDDSYTTANSSFGFASPYGPMHGGFKKESPAAKGFASAVTSPPGLFGKQNIARGGRGIWDSAPVNSVGVGGRGRGKLFKQASTVAASTPSTNFGRGQMKTRGAAGASAVKRLMDYNFQANTATYADGFISDQQAYGATTADNFLNNKTGSLKQVEDYANSVVALQPASELTQQFAYGDYEYGYADYGQTGVVGGESTVFVDVNNSSSQVQSNPVVAPGYESYDQYYAQYTPVGYGNYAAQ